VRLIREGAEERVSGRWGIVEIGDVAGCMEDLLRRGLKGACGGPAPRTVIFFISFCLFFIFSIKNDAKSSLFAFTHWIFQIRSAKLS